MKSIGWIGVGIMGKPMVRNLQKAGYTLHIYARNREKVADVIQEGAIFHDTIGDCAQGRDAVITMVGFPKDVEEVYFAPGLPGPGYFPGQNRPLPHPWESPPW